MKTDKQKERNKWDRQKSRKEEGKEEEQKKGITRRNYIDMYFVVFMH